MPAKKGIQFTNDIGNVLKVRKMHPHFKTNYNDFVV